MEGFSDSEVLGKLWAQLGWSRDIIPVAAALPMVVIDGRSLGPGLPLSGTIEDPTIYSASTLSHVHRLFQEAL